MPVLLWQKILVCSLLTSNQFWGKLRQLDSRSTKKCSIGGLFDCSLGIQVFDHPLEVHIDIDLE